MRLGLLADVRGALAPLRTALALLAEEGCDRVACLGSTVEGGEDDDAVLAALRDSDALLLPSPHDVRDAVTSLASEATLGGVTLTHATPEAAVPDDVLWLTAMAVPSALRAAEQLRADPRARAFGDLYAPVAFVPQATGLPRRRVFLAPDVVECGDAPWLACPGSVALAPTARHGGCIMTWDDATRRLSAIPFGKDGRLAPSDPLLRILAYGEELEGHLPDDDVVRRASLVVRTDADGIVADVEKEQPDLVLIDYHLAGKLSGLDAILALRGGRPAMPVTVFTITSNPTDSESMKSAGAAWGLPHAYLKDALTRLIVEATG